MVFVFKFSVLSLFPLLTILCVAVLAETPATASDHISDSGGLCPVSDFSANDSKVSSLNIIFAVDF